MGKEGQTVPEMIDEWVETISKRYIELFEKVTGTKFEPQRQSSDEVYNNITSALKAYV